MTAAADMLITLPPPAALDEAPMGAMVGVPNVGWSSQQSPAERTTPPREATGQLVPTPHLYGKSGHTRRLRLSGLISWPDLECAPPRSENDVRLRLDRLAQSALLEEKGPIGPACFSPRIHEEPFPTGSMLPQDTPKYNSTAKPEDWLIDYTIAVGIARGNKRVAMRYDPLMLTDSTQTWLNNMLTDIINTWVDFEEPFFRNFTDTYKRPGHPRELAMCVQAADEPLGNYLTRWTKLLNSYEGVHKV
ncbi:Endoglucanase 3 [Hordeum vulgare]|nr:Endoglucanase 3 [Hordeum vulgare]